MPKCCSRIIYFLLVSLAAITLPHKVTANPLSESATVSATVPAQPTPTPVPTGAPPTLTTPILIEPKNIVSKSNILDFVWKRSTHEYPFYYDLFLNGDATYLGISDIGNTLKANFKSRIDNDLVRLTPLIALPDGIYYWLVMAYDLGGNSATSTTFRFEIDTVPPTILVTDIDYYTGLALNSEDPASVPEDLEFQIRGPKDIRFRIETEPFAYLQLTFFTPDGKQVAYTEIQTDYTGIGFPYQHLEPGAYRVQVVAVDRASNTSALPEFKLLITKVSIPIPGIPGITEPTEVIIPPAPSLPATIREITAPTFQPLLYLLALALAVLLLLWALRQRYNLILIDKESLRTIKKAIVFHSLPDTRSNGSPVFKTRREPIKYELTYPDQGRLFIRKLSRYSTLTILLEENPPIVLSLSTNQRRYTIPIAQNSNSQPKSK